MSNLSRKYACRICGDELLEDVLSFGRMPLANLLLTYEELDKPELTYPLDLVRCPSCSLVQITETVAPEVLFREYLYFSSFSDTMLRHASELVERIIHMKSLSHGNLVVEIASNDGYLLQHYKKSQIPVLGIEPATNVARLAREKLGIPTITEFFDTSLAADLAAKGQKADVIHMHNVLAHVSNLHSVVEGVRLLLKEDGLCVIEVPYLKKLIEQCEFDTIYHEHLCYFSLTSLVYLMKCHELSIVDVEQIPIHGGSLRLFVKHDVEVSIQASVQALLDEEIRWGLLKKEIYSGFSDRALKLKIEFRNLIQDLKRRGKRIAAYGAAAKGSTLLNYFEIGKEWIDFVVDRNVYKQNRFMPGVRIPIFSLAKIEELMPEYIVLLVWNFSEEVLQQQASYRRRGGHFIFPIPEIKIV
ncbi:class I SAM-dependent methyltransferase [Pajaroellobacter abortibovis]|uniref:Methyltransferase n=1 Tax=Pajaroellobacter abortibovis TaxID=1882918 RepID=A0A1L6MVQ5_9BACT|nr:class I SAM-dependent methyltransferase [Pajaroellobacter abortibovis]APR99591.1 methyltransferase [Pajaroellobacter abortibovis]